MDASYLTVKQVTTDGSTFLWPAKRVSISAGKDTPKQLSFDSDDDVRSTIASGRVFIMNAAGKTVEVVDFEFERQSAIDSKITHTD